MKGFEVVLNNPSTSIVMDNVFNIKEVPSVYIPEKGLIYDTLHISKFIDSSMEEYVSILQKIKNMKSPNIGLKTFHIVNKKKENSEEVITSKELYIEFNGIFELRKFYKTLSIPFDDGKLRYVLHIELIKLTSKNKGSYYSLNNTPEPAIESENTENTHETIKEENGGHEDESTVSHEEEGSEG